VSGFRRGAALLLSAACAAVAACDTSAVVVARIPLVDGGTAGDGTAGDGTAGDGAAGDSAAGGPAVPQAGMGAMHQPDPLDVCPLHWGYNLASYIGANGCRVPESHPATAFLTFIFSSFRPPPSAGETREQEWCEIFGVSFYQDQDTNDYVVCPRACEWVMAWTVDQLNAHFACLEEAGIEQR
jgi:hypothetical protein